MYRSLRRSMLRTLLLIVVLTACGPTTTPLSIPSTTPEPIASPESISPATPEPIASPESISSATPEPTATTLSTPSTRPEPIASPESISSATSEPTAIITQTPRNTYAFNNAFGLTPMFEGQVDVGGTRLYLVCFGEGTPTVVLDAGADMTPDTWKDVVTELYSHTRTCAFNRAGYGWSTGPVEPRSAHTHAEMLHTLLVNAQIEGPYILVGHSIAVLSDIVFADQFPEDTAGLVLVDGSHPDQCERRRDALPPESPDDSEDLQNFRSFFVDCDTFWSRITSQSGDRWLDSSGNQVRAVTSLGDLPLIVLFNGSTTGQRGDIPPALIAKLDQTKADMQSEYAALSSNGLLVVVENTSHLIQNDQPQVVVEAILQVLARYR